MFLDSLSNLWNPFYDVFSTTFCDVWRAGAYGGWWFVFTTATLLCIAQMLWTLWRYIDDADERDLKTMDDERVCRAISRDSLNVGWLSCFGVRRHSAGEFYMFVVIIIVVGGGIIVAAWPFLLITGTLYGMLKAARGSRRMQKAVKRAVSLLKRKADKNHDHDKQYRRI